MLVAEWVRRSEDDLAFARMGASMNPPRPWGIAFHSQQSVEKIVKAYLVWEQIEFPYTHEIATLLNMSSQLRTSSELLDAISLTGYAIAVRYPGVEPSLQEAMKSLEIAHRVHDFVVKLLIDQGAARAS